MRKCRHEEILGLESSPPSLYTSSLEACKYRVNHEGPSLVPKQWKLHGA